MKFWDDFLFGAMAGALFYKHAPVDIANIMLMVVSTCGFFVMLSRWRRND